jgi:DNA transformation protein and related proteins
MAMVLKRPDTRRKKRAEQKSRRLRSLKVSETFREFVLDQLSELGDVAAKSMFGGVGLYSDGVFFGIIARDALYLKVDDDNRPEYEAAGMGPFNPYLERSHAMKYYEVPLAVLESPMELAAWARRSIAAARGAG